jgi:hypothetical protein
VCLLLLGLLLLARHYCAARHCRRLLVPGSRLLSSWR